MSRHPPPFRPTHVPLPRSLPPHGGTEVELPPQPAPDHFLPPMPSPTHPPPLTLSFALSQTRVKERNNNRKKEKKRRRRRRRQNKQHPTSTQGGLQHPNLSGALAAVGQCIFALYDFHCAVMANGHTRKGDQAWVCQARAHCTPRTRTHTTKTCTAKEEHDTATPDLVHHSCRRRETHHFRSRRCEQPAKPSSFPQAPFPRAASLCCPPTSSGQATCNTAGVWSRAPQPAQQATPAVLLCPAEAAPTPPPPLPKSAFSLRSKRRGTRRRPHPWHARRQRPPSRAARRRRAACAACRCRTRTGCAATSAARRPSRRTARPRRCWWPTLRRRRSRGVSRRQTAGRG